jgi:hypothetical protein
VTQCVNDFSAGGQARLKNRALPPAQQIGLEQATNLVT